MAEYDEQSWYVMGAYRFNDRMGRLQLNYVSVSGDEEDYNGEAGGGDNRYDAILGQLQLYF